MFKMIIIRTSPIIIFFMILGFLVQNLLLIESQELVPRVVWRIYSDVGELGGGAYTVCEKDEYIYVVGSQGTRPRIEMRLKSNGSLINTWVSNIFYKPLDCVVVGNRLYVVGWYNTILMFDLNLNLLRHTDVNFSYSPSTIESYENYLYIGGVESLGDRWRWRIEMRKTDDLSLIKSFTSSESQQYDNLYVIKINPVTKQLWAVGADRSRLKIMILDQMLNLLKTIYREDLLPAYALDFDEEGNAYMGMGSFMAKLDKEGNEISWRKTSYDNRMILYVKGYIFVAANEMTGMYFRQSLYVLDKHLRDIFRMTLSRDLDSASFDVGRMIFDGQNIYLAGYGANIWMIYKIEIVSNIPVSDIETVTMTKILTEEFHRTILRTVTYHEITYFNNTVTTSIIKTITMRTDYESGNMMAPIIMFTIIGVIIGIVASSIHRLLRH